MLQKKRRKKSPLPWVDNTGGGGGGGGGGCVCVCVGGGGGVWIGARENRGRRNPGGGPDMAGRIYELNSHFHTFQWNPLQPDTEQPFRVHLDVLHTGECRCED